MSHRWPPKSGVIGRGGPSEERRDKPKLLEVDPGVDPPGPDGIVQTKQGSTGPLITSSFLDKVPSDDEPELWDPLPPSRADERVVTVAGRIFLVWG